MSSGLQVRDNSIELLRSDDEESKSQSQRKTNEPQDATSTQESFTSKNLHSRSLVATRRTGKDHSQNRSGDRPWSPACDVTGGDGPTAVPSCLWGISRKLQDEILVALSHVPSCCGVTDRVKCFVSRLVWMALRLRVHGT